MSSISPMGHISKAVLASRSSSRLFLGVCSFIVLLIIARAGLFGSVEAAVEQQRLELNKAVERELKGGETHSYELALEAGQFADVTIEQLGVNVRGVLQKPDGKVITETDSHRGVRGLEMACLIAEMTGVYRLNISSMKPLVAPGKYRVIVTALRPATSQDRARMAAQELYAEGELYRRKTDRASWDKARNAYQRALAKWVEIDDRPRQAVTLRQISALSGRLMLGPEALDEGARALELYRALRDRSGEAHALFTMAEGLSWTLNEKDRALELYEQSLRICREIGEHLIEGLVLQKLAVLSHLRGEKQKALDYVQPSLALLLSAGERGDASSSFGELRAICESLDDKSKVLAVFDRVQSLSRKNGERKVEAEALIEIAEIHKALGETQKALDAFNEASAIFRANADRDGEARALIAAGWFFVGLNKKLQTLDYFNRALAIYTALGDRRGQATVSKFLGMIYASTGQMQKALERSYQSLQIWRELDNPAEEASALFTLGEVYRDLGDWEKALEVNEQAARRFHAIGDRAGEAKVLIYVGIAFHALGEYPQAIERLNRAITLCRGLGSRRDEAFALSLLATVYGAQGDVKKSLDTHLRCLSLARAAGDRHLEAGVLHNLGWLHFHHRDKQQAVEYQAQAAELYRRIGDLAGEANALRGLGRAYGATGQMEKGVDLCRKAVAIAQASREPAAEAIALYGLALLYIRDERFAEARENVEAALRVHESVRANVTNRDLRASYLAAAHEYYESYIDLLMRMHRQDRNKGHAVEAFQFSEGSRARSLLELLSTSRAGQDAPDELVERERNLQRRINATSEALRTLKSKPHTAEQAADLDRQLTVLSLDLQQVSDRINSAKPGYVAFAETQSLSLAEIQRQVLDADTLLLEYSLGQERSYLWAVAPDSINDFTLPKRAVIEEQAKKVYELMTARGAKRKDETEAQWQDRCIAAGKQFPEEAAKLSRMLLGPVAARLGGKRLLIVADGALQYIPFAALPEPETEGRRGGGMERKRDGATVSGKPLRSVPPSPLIVNHEIISLPSASTLAVLRRKLAGRASAPKMAAVLADPVFTEDDPRVPKAAARASSDQPPVASPLAGSIARYEALRSAAESGVMEGEGQLRRLEFSRKELETIAAKASKDQFFQALGFDASRAMAMSEALGQYRIIHFATHGSINSRHPELSGLIFSLVNEKGEAQDGFLRAREIYGLKLNADLVTLSACRTALGKDVRGEGLIGMTRGFMYAGASRALASLWAVKDEETASLMAAFYKRLLGEDGQMRMTPAAALRQAQIEMWRSKRRGEPFFWAGFVLQGEYK